MFSSSGLPNSTSMLNFFRLRGGGLLSLLSFSDPGKFLFSLLYPAMNWTLFSEESPSIVLSVMSGNDGS